jgi:hypothetical protein
MRKILYFIIFLLLAPLLLAFTVEGFRFLRSVFSFESTLWFLLGAGLSFLVLILVRGSWSFLQVLLHELEHAVVLFLFTFDWPTAMLVTPVNGEVRARGMSKFFWFWIGPLIVWAPYYFPLLTLPILLLKALAALVFSLLGMPFPPFLAAILDLLIGATLMLHLLTSIIEFHGDQTDLKDIGMIVSFFSILYLNFMFIVLSIAVVTDTYAEYWTYVKTAFATAVEYYQAIWAWLKVTVPPALDALRQALKELL